MTRAKRMVCVLGASVFVACAHPAVVGLVVDPNETANAHGPLSIRLEDYGLIDVEGQPWTQSLFRYRGVWSADHLWTNYMGASSSVPSAVQRLGWGPSDETLGRALNGTGTRALGIVTTYAYGWPFLSCVSEYDQVGWRRVRGIAVGAHASGVERVIPTGVMWGGMLMNIAAYALVVGVVVEWSVWSRRSVRRARWERGVCGRCGYEVGDLEKCSECGAERVTPRPSRRPA